MGKILGRARGCCYITVCKNKKIPILVEIPTLNLTQTLILALAITLILILPNAKSSSNPNDNLRNKKE